MKEIPVFLFLGFLESGKTRFIQETMEDPRFESGEKTLLLVFEEGEIEYDERKFAVKKYAIEYLEAETLTEDTLKAVVKKHRPDRVMIEWNGMVTLETLFDAMPNGWMINQMFTFFDTRTFLGYNQNMRQLVFDKIQYTQLVVFNRYVDDVSQMELHRIVRGISRGADIVYEYEDGRIIHDEIVDPLPFDIDAPIVQIKEEDYAYFYRDLVEELPKYEGKTVQFKGICVVDKRFPKGTFVCGRHVMTCCEEDTAYSGMVCVADFPVRLNTRDWIVLTGKISIGYHSIYGQEGPILNVIDLTPADPPEKQVAKFY